MDIEVIRPKQYQDLARNYQLEIDGEYVAELEPDTTTIITIPDNAKIIQAKIDWCSSPAFAVKDINSKKLLIKNTSGGNFFKALFGPLYYITLGRKNYLTIENCRH